MSAFFPSFLPWYSFPQIELARFKAIDFFPPKPRRFEDLTSICLGSKTRTIGDALVLSSLPRQLKRRYPGLKIFTYPRGFNPVVFWNNPYVDGITFLPDALFGDDNNEGSGHLIQLKERFFGLEPSEKPKPELYLTDSEKSWARNYVREHSREDHVDLPLLIIHPFGHNFTKVLTPEIWKNFVAEHSKSFRVVQVGVQGQLAIAGCDFHFLAPKKRGEARRLFALIGEADRFIGVDSGPMHIARAFAIPSLVVTDGDSPEDIFKRRHEGPYYLYRNWIRAFLYEDLPHLYVPVLDGAGILKGLGDFASR